MSIEREKEEFAGRGYFIVRRRLRPRYAGTARDRLLERLEQGAVFGEVDVAGMGPDAGAIFGLIAPEFGEPVFGEHFLTPKLLQYVEAFLGKELRLGYVPPAQRPGVLRHRLAPGCRGKTNRDLPYDEEIALLNKPKTNFRWQLALIDDPCLWLVPWSQNRYPHRRGAGRPRFRQTQGPARHGERRPQAGGRPCSGTATPSTAASCHPGLRSGSS